MPRPRVGARGRIALIGLLLTVGLLVGCGSSDDDAGGAASTTVAPSTTSAARAERTLLAGFDEVPATLTAPDGTVCRVCLLAARTPARQAQGLMGVRDPELGGYDGMVFVYEQPVTGEFWMRRTPLPLDIAWFDGDGAYLGRSAMQPCGDRSDCRLYPAPAPFRYALEVPAGGLDEVGAVPGAVLRLGSGPCPLTGTGR